MGGLHGVIETGKVLELLVEIGNVSEQMVLAKKEGGDTLQVLAKLVSLGDEVYALIGMDFKQLVLELKEIDSNDMDVLKAQAIAKFDLSNEDAQELIIEGIELLDALGDVVIQIKKFVKRALKK